MKLEYLAQPDVQLGRILSALLNENPSADVVVVVSAFARLQSILRLKQQVSRLVDEGADIRFVLGIDLGGTSKEVLEELLKWNIDVTVVKNRIPGHTFHPKIYLLRWKAKADLFVCSNNLTDGGFFRNYEAAARVTYDLPADHDGLETALAQLGRFLGPTGATAKKLTTKLLKNLVKNGQVPSEADARRNTEPANQKLRGRRVGSVFGAEDVAPPPPLPAEMLERLLGNLRARRGSTGGKTQRRRSKAKAQSAKKILAPAAFYMTLPTLQGPNIPGEARIPLEAVELAEEFWGWPDEYKKDVTGGGKKRRVYWNWRPNWSIVNADTGQSATQVVRMYLYENSSDFRFYARPLVNAGADLGDVVRIRRVAQPDAEYECVLAKKGTAAFEDWGRYCTQQVRNSPRRFGYA